MILPRFFSCFSLVMMLFVALQAPPATAASTTKDTKGKGEVIQSEGAFRDTITIGALDKVTGRTSDVTFKVGEIIRVGTLAIQATRAWSTNPDEAPEAKVFFEILDYDAALLKKKNLEPSQEPSARGLVAANRPHQVFRGWMLASEPSASSLEHPVYNIWVKSVSGKPMAMPHVQQAHHPSDEAEGIPEGLEDLEAPTSSAQADRDADPALEPSLQEKEQTIDDLIDQLMDPNESDD